MNTDTQTSWTPGPWKAAAKISSVVGLPIVAPRSMGRSIGHATVMPKDMDGAEDFNREALANAAVMAAGPELVAMLQKYIEAVNPTDREWISLDVWNKRLKAATAEARVLLACIGA